MACWFIIIPSRLPLQPYHLLHHMHHLPGTGVLDSIGLCSGAWFMALIHKQLVGFQVDQVYVGKPEQHAAAAKEVAGKEA
jgi:Silicon transporter